jgi:uncharacterized protein
MGKLVAFTRGFSMRKYLSSLHIYPVKSFKGLSLQTVEVGAKGPHLDRRLMVIDKDGRFLSQRQHHNMALITTELVGTKLILRAPKKEECEVEITAKGPKREVIIWKDTVLACDQGDMVAKWLSDVLQTDVRLVFMPDETIRQVNQQYAPRVTDQAGFTDGYPFLIISEASLEELNSRLEKPIPMDRFRPSLVISGCSPFEEDTWEKIRIGNIIFDCVKPCSRCIVTTIDQATWEKWLEPLQTLATYRKQEGGIMFGQNAIHQGPGKLSVSDEVEILEKEK